MMKDIYFSNNNEPVEIEDIYSDSSFENGQPQPPAPGRKQKKKRHPVRTIIKIIVSAIIIVSLLISGMALISKYTRSDLKKNEYVTGSELANNPLITNILLIGTDEESSGTARSDSMILLSLDFIHGKIKMTSFLRDCWVEIPSSGKKMKLNAAFVYGGAQLLCDTIEYNFRVDIDHYVKVDFEMFTGIINKLGGIDIEVTQKEADFINRTTRHTIESGSSVHLNGDQALVYARIRKLDSDYMRTYRQRKIIGALIEKVKHSSPFELIKTVNSVLPMLETDISALEMPLNAYRGILSAVMFDIVQTKMPRDEMMTTGYVGSQWAEIPDLEKCREGIYKFIYTSDSEFDNN